MPSIGDLIGGNIGPNDVAPGGLRGTYFAQQWTPNKHLFALMLWARERVNMRVLLAWMAVESGGALDSPQGGKFNYLQLMSGGGFLDFKTVRESYRATVFAVRARPEILAARGKGPAAQMDAIARTWRWGGGNAQPLDSTEVQVYRQRLQAKYDAINPKEIQFWFGLSPEGRARTRDFMNRLTSEEDNWGEKALDAAGDVVGGAFAGLADAIWPALLKTALAGTALALLGYGVKQLAGSSAAAEHTKQATSTAGTAVAAAT